MISIYPLISKSSSPCTKPLVTILSAPITIGITINFIFYSFFISLAKYWYLSLFLLSFIFTFWSARMAQSTIQSVFFSFFFLLLSLGLVTWLIQRILCVSFSRMISELCIFHLFGKSDLNFLHNSQWSTFPTELYVVLYSFCTNLLQLHIILLIVSFDYPFVSQNPREFYQKIKFPYVH